MTQQVFRGLLAQCVTAQKDVVQKQAIKSVCIILQNKKIRQLKVVEHEIRQLVDQKVE